MAPWYHQSYFPYIFCTFNFSFVETICHLSSTVASYPTTAQKHKEGHPMMKCYEYKSKSQLIYTIAYARSSLETKANSVKTIIIQWEYIRFSHFLRELQHLIMIVIVLWNLTYFFIYLFFPHFLVYSNRDAIDLSMYERKLL